MTWQSALARTKAICPYLNNAKISRAIAGFAGCILNGKNVTLIGVSKDLLVNQPGTPFSKVPRLGNYKAKCGNKREALTIAFAAVIVTVRHTRAFHKLRIPAQAVFTEIDDNAAERIMANALGGDPGRMQGTASLTITVPTEGFQLNRWYQLEGSGLITNEIRDLIIGDDHSWCYVGGGLMRKILNIKATTVSERGDGYDLLVPPFALPAALPPFPFEHAAHGAMWETMRRVPQYTYFRTSIDLHHAQVPNTVQVVKTYTNVGGIEGDDVYGTWGNLPPNVGIDQYLQALMTNPGVLVVAAKGPFCRPEDLNDTMKPQLLVWFHPTVQEMREVNTTWLSTTPRFAIAPSRYSRTAVRMFLDGLMWNPVPLARAKIDMGACSQHLRRVAPHEQLRLPVTDPLLQHTETYGGFCVQGQDPDPGNASECAICLGEITPEGGADGFGGQCACCKSIFHVGCYGQWGRCIISKKVDEIIQIWGPSPLSGALDALSAFFAAPMVLLIWPEQVDLARAITADPLTDITVIHIDSNHLSENNASVKDMRALSQCKTILSLRAFKVTARQAAGVATVDPALITVWNGRDSTIVRPVTIVW